MFHNVSALRKESHTEILSLQNVQELIVISCVLTKSRVAEHKATLWSLHKWSWVWALKLQQCLWTWLHVCGLKRLSWNAGSRSHTKGESEDHTARKAFCTCDAWMCLISIHVEEPEFSFCFDRWSTSALAFMVLSLLIQWNQVTGTFPMWKILQNARIPTEVVFINE